MFQQLEFTSNVSQKLAKFAHRDLIKQIVESVSCPIIANGDVFEYGDFQKMREQTGRLQCLGVEQCGINQFFGRKDCFRKEKISRH